MDDLLDNAQIAINDAATQAGGPPPAPEPPPPPAPEPPPPEAGQVKKRPIGILIATFLFLAGTVVFGARIIGQQRQIAEIRTSAATDPCKECNSSKKCVKTDKANCGPSLNECAVDADCQGVARPTPTPKSEGPSWRIKDGTCQKFAGPGMTLAECQAKLKETGGGGGKSTLCPYNCVQKSKCTGKNLGLGYGDCGAALFEYCCETGGGGGGECKIIGYEGCLIDYDCNGDGKLDKTERQPNCGGGDGGGGGGKTPQCNQVKIYKGGAVVTDLSSLKVNDQITIAVSGKLASKARVRVNGASWTETSTKNGQGEFTLDFTILAESIVNNKISIEAEIYGLDKKWH